MTESTCKFLIQELAITNVQGQKQHGTMSAIAIICTQTNMHKNILNLIMWDKGIEERLRVQREDPPKYDEKGRLVHIPDWAYEDMF